jgi:hypothetical protein
MCPLPQKTGRHCAGQLLPGTSLQSSCWQRNAPPAELHASTVHGSSSKQLRASPVQAPARHTSSVVQGLLSWQKMPSLTGVRTQPWKNAQNSVVHGLWSSQSTGEPKPQKKPKLQCSPTVQGLPSSHGSVGVP